MSEITCDLRMGRPRRACRSIRLTRDLMVDGVLFTTGMIVVLPQAAAQFVVETNGAVYTECGMEYPVRTETIRHGDPQVTARDPRP